MAGKLLGSAIQSGTITTTQLSTTIITTINDSGGPKVKSIAYPGSNTAVDTAGGQTIVITGTGFNSGIQVYLNGNAAPSTTRTNANSVSFTTPALSAATYPIYLINTDGGTAIYLPGLQYSGTPSWVTGATLSDQDSVSAWNVTLSATSDSSVTYALAAGNTLPSGVTLAANGLISGTMSSPPGSDTTYSFSVVATDAEVQTATRTFSVTVTVSDPYFNYTTLLIHANGTNNGNNHTFVDSSTNNFAVTRSGNATQGSFSPFSQNGWCGYFDGNGDYLSIAGNTIMNFGSGDWTVEAWVYLNAMPTSDAWPTNYSSHFVLATVGTANLGDGIGCIIGQTKLLVQSNDTQYASSTHGMSINTWYHIAYVRSGNTIYFFVNGVAKGTVAFTGSVGTGGTTWIGCETGQGAYFNGYISNLRINKGSALYTSAFTPATSALSVVANTSLLTLQSNRVVDSNTTPSRITLTGDTKILPFSPFAPNTTYSTANVGGSLYLDASGDYLTVADNTAFNLAGGTYTIDGWIYPSGNYSNYRTIIAKRVDGGSASTAWEVYLRTSTGVLSFYNGTNYESSVTPYPNSWNHFAAVFDGTNINLYLNGTRVLQSAITNSNISASVKIGSYPGYSEDFGGYIANLRIVKGYALYSGTTLTVPTALTTAVTGTSLLMNFNNAQIFDQTSRNVFETVGDAKSSTTQFKYGTGSMYFDGTGDYLLVPSSPNFSFGSGNFTIEFWGYNITGAGNWGVFSFGATAGSDFAGITMHLTGGLYLSTSGSSWAYTNVGSIILSSNDNQWHHYAIVRNGSNLLTFKDGTQQANVSISGSLVNNGGVATIGAKSDSLSATVNGYIDDFRVTKGLARYTANFTAPTSAFKDR